MKIPRETRILAAALAVLMRTAASAWADAAPESVTLPDAVAGTFARTFPKGEIVKRGAEEENGVMVYDIEFRDGGVEKETDIVADGTMLEFSFVIAEKDVPSVAMKALRAAAAGATIQRIEQVELSYEIKDAKLIRLRERVTNYEALLTREEKYAEAVVSSAGGLIEAPTWDASDEGTSEDEGEAEDEAGE